MIYQHLNNQTMKTTYLLAIMLCFIFLFQVQESHSQSKYGNATMDELNMTVYPEDTTASAVILLKKGDLRFIFSELYGFQFEYAIQVKIKILKTEKSQKQNLRRNSLPTRILTTH